MDFSSQPKLSKAEWNSVEEPVPADEKLILEMIIAGYNNIAIRHNHNHSILNMAKIDKSDLIENFIYNEFFKKSVVEIQAIRGIPEPIQKFSVKEEAIKHMKKADKFRLENMGNKINENKKTIIEYVFLELAKETVKYYSPNFRNIKYGFYLYSLIQLRNVAITNINVYLIKFIDIIIENISSNTQLNQVIFYAYDFIEKNQYIYKYGDISLYDHQKRLFTVFKNTAKQLAQLQRHENASIQTTSVPANLVLYIAPTGTGKTLSPIGLSNEFRVIFVCAARHIGIALAKSAISVNKCVAFAFGCETAADIRLHYFSALTYKIDKRSGGIGKVDNSVGNKVEIMICDSKSYLTAMYYMLSFNQPHRMITYWDEPTIGMDIQTGNAINPLHEITHRNWSENKIPNMVLSSATLPNITQLNSVVRDFRAKFNNLTVTEINSYDCNKSITLLDKMGHCVCPHLLYENYNELQQCADYCKQNKTLLRYFDLREVVRFIIYVTRSGDIKDDFCANNYFEDKIENIKMNSIKLYYIDLLKQIDELRWPFIFKAIKESAKRCLPGERETSSEDLLKKSVSVDSGPAMQSRGGSALTRTTSVFTPTQKPKTTLDLAKEKSVAYGGIFITTVDAHTLTDGPTIYMAEDVDKIGQFYIQQSCIPAPVIDEIMLKIQQNNTIMKSIEKLELELQDTLGKEQEKEKKMSNSELLSPKARKIEDNIDSLRASIEQVSLDSKYVPNTTDHQSIWVSDDKNKMVKNAFVPYIDPNTVKKIMELFISDGLKILLLLGIGIFNESNNSEYNEIVKQMAYNKQLFIIIATSDYIYGTNYQFCHGFLGKDLQNMTQQKTIQALGRIGRNNIQQEYTARFRDDALIKQLFCENVDNIEAENMCRLLVTDNDE